MMELITSYGKAKVNPLIMKPEKWRYKESGQGPGMVVNRYLHI